MPKVVVKEPKIEKPLMKHARSFSVICYVAAILQSMSATDGLSSVRKLVESVEFDVQLAETVEENGSCLQV